MNARIEELIEESYHYSDMALDIWFNKEKFAKLIAKECMTIAQEFDGTKLGGPGLIIAMRIEQHFGVEE